MAETAGYEGMIYYRHGYAKGTLTFNDNSPSADTIVGAGSLIASAGFLASDTFNVSGTTSNDGSYTIASVSASTITVGASSTLVNQSSVASTILDATPGTALAGFYNWTINYKADLYDTTAFEDSGTRTYIGGMKDWGGTAEKYYMTSDSRASWVGSTVHVRFFMKYEATPNASSAARYIEGSAVVTATNTTTPVDGVIGQSLTFQGKGALAIVTRTTAW